jgi:hypothetical protein
MVTTKDNWRKLPEDGFPPVGKTVFAWAKPGGLMYCAYRMVENGRERWNYNYLNITHWQPRPEPPIDN